jgi:hypothetical protein
MLRHLVATLAYRAAKVLREPPAGFGAFHASPAARRPAQIVAHMADLMSWGVTLAHGEYAWKADGSDDWDAEVGRFFDRLGALDRALETVALPEGAEETLIQGPLADALTHVGQVAMLRGLSGAPVRPENYARADIAVGRVGVTQSSPVREFDGDASARK